MRYKSIDAAPDGVKRLIERASRRAAEPPAGAPNADAPAPVKAGRGGNKLRAIRCENEFGEVFDSKLERSVCATLRKVYGHENVIRQVSLPIGLQRIVPDFLIIHGRDVFGPGTFVGELVDAKGWPTPAWKTKARRLEKQHGLSIRLIKK